MTKMSQIRNFIASDTGISVTIMVLITGGILFFGNAITTTSERTQQNAIKIVENQSLNNDRMSRIESEIKSVREFTDKKLEEFADKLNGITILLVRLAEKNNVNTDLKNVNYLNYDDILDITGFPNAR